MNIIMSLRSKKYFLSLLYTISTFFVVVSILLSLFLYFSFKSFGIDLINRSSQKLLSQISNNVDFIDSYVKNNNAALFSNLNATQLMYDDNINIYDTLRNINSLNNFVKSTPFIYSVYAYNGNLNRFYVAGSENNILDSDTFYDKEMIKLFESHGDESSNLPIARRLQLPHTSSSAYMDVYTYFISEARSNHSVKNGLVLNVNIDWIFNKLIKNQNDTASTVMLLNPEGVVVGHSKSKLFLNNLSEQSYVKKIMSYSQASGYFVDVLDGEKSVVVYSTIANLNWKIINVIPYRTIAQSIDKVKSITLTICLLIFAAGLALSYVISRRLYLPVGILRQKVESLLNKHSSPVELTNEFQYIENNISNVMDLLLSLSKFKNSNLNLLKQELLQSILNGKTPVVNRLKELNVRFAPQSQFIVVLFKIDFFEDFQINRSEEERALLRFALTNISNEIFAEHFHCESLDSGADHTISIISTDRDPNALHAELKILIRKIMDVNQSYFNISVSSFISEHCDSLTEIHDRYKKAQSYSLSRIRFGHSCIISHRDLLSNETEKVDISDHRISELLEALKNVRKDQVEKIFADIIQKLFLYDYNNIMFTLSHVTSSIFITLNHIERNSTVKFEIDYKSFHETIMKLETLEQIREAFFTFFDYIVTTLNTHKDKDKRYHEMIGTVTLYIQNHYMDKNLFQNAIADMLKISPVTLGKAFREITGETLVDYIKDVRLSKAKEYLRDTNYSIDEIIEEIGWGNKKYFSTIFKQNFGVTPMEYRFKSSQDKM
ncbi:helix-turn-helix domain-containing protein [Paenibacillus sp. LMG 31461]|uniref:Helix-turn-helix domain-containing protein n=1 Tax=Paenibacillus plantarum TaxID=2654975 RepID=A0ABX1XC93_9BACL|nr:helix-turn-helix domain-containing protein [Paenibacillus plantarum]NOU66078.1 helix-turn-helix domain-containing protein [Paenibacillus plantarum]